MDSEDVTPAEEKIISTHQEAEYGDAPVAQKIVDWRKWLLRSERIAKGIRTWALTLILLILAVAFINLIIREINDKSYHVQTFRVPEDLARDGYDGITVAYQLLDEVNEMIRYGNHTRSLKTVEAYNQSADRTQLQVEVAGVGISPETITTYFKQALGVNTHSINGEIVKKTNSLKLFIRISGQEPETIDQLIDSLDIHAALEKLMRRGAQVVLKKNNPLLLGLYYTEKGNNELAIESFRYAIHQQPAQASNAYAWWGEALFRAYDDTTVAMPKVRKALALDPKSATAYAVMASRGEFSKESREKFFRKSLSFDSSWVTTWDGLANLLSGNKDREEEAGQLHA